MPQAAVKEKLKTDIVTKRSTCRICGGERLTKVWSFGETPLANSYLKPEEVGKREELFVPLDIYFCGDCYLVQMLDVVSPHALFDHYLYVSSTSPIFVKHFKDYAAHLLERFELKDKALVVDVGSNDGVLLKPLQEAGARVLGIDPAKNIALQATTEGIETWAQYFTPEVAMRIKQEKGEADVIAANNVFAHTDEIASFTEAAKTLLTDDGVFVFEVQYLGDLLAKNLFDIVYHEHVCYYSVHPLVKFFAKREMEIFDVERLKVHGGSIRVYVKKRGAVGTGLERTRRLRKILEEEKAAGLTTLKAYQEFGQRIENNKQKLSELLAELKSRGKKIVGYGAPAKATTLMYVMGLDSETIEYIVDDDARYKQGMVMPGTHVPIVSPDYLYKGKDKPDYCLILAWNFAEPIMKNHKNFIKQGGRFIVPVPEPTII